MGGGGGTSFPMRPTTSTPRQTAAREGGVEGDWALSLSAVAMDRSKLPRAMPTGAIERFIVSYANPQQANSQQSTSPVIYPVSVFPSPLLLAWTDLNLLFQIKILS